MQIAWHNGRIIDFNILFLFLPIRRVSIPFSFCTRASPSYEQLAYRKHYSSNTRWQMKVIFLSRYYRCVASVCVHSENKEVRRGTK
jgi:hypothetical protein